MFADKTFMFYGQIEKQFSHKHQKFSHKNEKFIMKFIEIKKKTRDRKFSCDIKFMPENNKMCQFGVKFINRYIYFL